MKFTKIITSIIALLFISYSYSQTYVAATNEQKSSLIKLINEASQNTRTLKCEFEQEKTVSILSETIISKGVMYFKKENKLRWQYNQPYPYIFILANGKVTIKNDNRIDNFDTNSNKMFKTISEIMIGGVNGDLLKDENNFKSEILIGDNNIIVKLIPQNKDLAKLMNTIKLSIGKQDWLVESIEMIETGGDNTLIKFTNKIVNAEVKDDKFIIN